MPRGDRMGPMGMGPMSGRAAGYCAGNSVPGFMSGGFGRNFGRGFGMGRGRGAGGGFFGRGFGSWLGFGRGAAPYVQPDAESEKLSLKHQAEAMQLELEQIRKRLEELENQKS